jgi:hypothetical protein
VRQSSSRYLKGEPGKHRNEYGNRRSNRPFAPVPNVVRLAELLGQGVSDLDVTHITEKYNPFTGKEFLQLPCMRAISNRNTSALATWGAGLSPND